MRAIIVMAWLGFAVILGAATGPMEARAAATIVVINNDDPGEGFNDPAPFTPVGGNNAATLGQARLNAFQYAADLWATCINSNVTIEVRANMDPQTCTATSATLGSASANTVHRDFANAPVANTWYSQALANSLAGVDLDPAVSDIRATFNSNINGDPGCLGGGSWYYGFDGNPGGNQFDFVTVVMHEIGHGLGFQTFVDRTTGELFMDRLDTYTLNMESAGAAPSMYSAMTDAERATANVSDPNLRWIGASTTAGHPVIPVTAGLNGGFVRLHGPNPSVAGSSLSHWSTAVTPNELMEPSYTAPDHRPSLAINLMADIGWSLDATPLQVNCPGDIVVECTGGGTPASNPAIVAFLAAASATGGCCEVEITHDAPAFFPLGTTTVTFTALDGANQSTTCSADVTVSDTTPPTITFCPGDQTVECSSHCGVVKSELSAWLDSFAATDVCDDDVDITNDAPDCFPLGQTVVTFTATDDEGLSSQCQATVTVEDTTPPEIDVVLDRDVLWPPNHKLATVCAEVTVTDICDADPTWVLWGAVSDEPDNDRGDGNTTGDIQGATLGTADVCIELRSERMGGEDGRKYTIYYQAMDMSGNVAYDTVCVRVPHDQSGAALASTGFSPDGKQLTGQEERFAVIIPGTDAVDASALEVSRIYLGNTGGVLRPAETRMVDANADGRMDLALFYQAEAFGGMVGISSSFDLNESNSNLAKDRGDGPVGIHYTTRSGVDYVVGNIFALGTPVEMPTVWHDITPPTIIVEPVTEPAPKATALSSIHPNPFNPQTTVAYTLSAATGVHIAIYDVRGSLVRSLVDASQAAGSHRAVWNGVDDSGRPATTGVYFVRMIAGSYSETRKIVMLK